MILGIDTATEWVHLALDDGQSSLARRLLTSPDRSASVVLLSLADELLQEAGAHRSDIKGVVTCIGPGGFTSLRVGIATSEGFGILGLPTWGFSAFELRAFSIRRSLQRGIVYIVMDGQRREAFLQPWDMEQMSATEKAVKVPTTALSSVIGDNDWWTPERFSHQLTSIMHSPPLAVENEGRSTLCALTELCRICINRPVENPLIPFYLRETDAEVNFPAASHHLQDIHRQGLAR
uniref:Putative molecular chaperone n=1 Tax=uncultured bacterium contig00038 TaxID=1181526 RepID=A0A806KFR8_9BACT|nr:putative molecular chaperone [uncultured bacterium contig00038]